MQFPVEAGHVLALSRALGEADGEPLLPPPGSPTPPTFTWCSPQLDPGHGRAPGEVDLPGARAGVRVPENGDLLHAEQRFTYARPVRVGDVLTVRESVGRSWQKQSSRSGTLTFVELVRDYLGEDGELSVRATMLLVHKPS